MILTLHKEYADGSECGIHVESRTSHVMFACDLVSYEINDGQGHDGHSQHSD